MIKRNPPPVPKENVKEDSQPKGVGKRMVITLNNGLKPVVHILKIPCSPAKLTLAFL
jgi:hypothetical protein